MIPLKVENISGQRRRNSLPNKRRNAPKSYRKKAKKLRTEKDVFNFSSKPEKSVTFESSTLSSMKRQSIRKNPQNKRKSYGKKSKRSIRAKNNNFSSVCIQRMTKKDDSLRAQRSRTFVKAEKEEFSSRIKETFLLSKRIIGVERTTSPLDCNFYIV